MAGQDSAGGVSGQVSSAGMATAIGAAAGMVAKGNTVMGGGGQAPLERGQKMIIPTPYGPKLFTTSSTDGNMMAAHTKDNADVDAKEQADMNMKERLVTAVEKVANSTGGQKVKGIAKKAGGGLFDLFKDLVSLPFTAIGGLVSSLVNIPILGPIALGVVGALGLKFGDIATKMGLPAGSELTQKVKDAGKAGLKPEKGAVGNVLKKLLGSKAGKVIAVLAAIFGYNILSDDDDNKAEASSKKDSEESVKETTKDENKDKKSSKPKYTEVTKRVDPNSYEGKGFIGKTIDNVTSIPGTLWDHKLATAGGIAAAGGAAYLNGLRQGGGGNHPQDQGYHPR
jgi:hypothetical protein